MTKTVVAIYNTIDEAKNAAGELIRNGFNQDDVDVSSGSAYVDDTREHESGVSRFFKNLFGNNESERYTRAAERGSVVTVHTHSADDAEKASRLLDEYGAIDVDDNYKHVTDTGDYRDERGERSNDLNKVIPVIEEDIKVGKREVPTGGVRIRSRIVEKPVEENLRLRHEHIHVERNKVDRPATEAEMSNFKTGTEEFTEHKEIPTIQKDSRVVEEVSLAKTVDHRDQTVRDNVRRTEVDVEDIKDDRRD